MTKRLIIDWGVKQEKQIGGQFINGSVDFSV